MQDDTHGMGPEKIVPVVVAEQTFDVSQKGPIRVSLNWKTQSVVLDFMADSQGGAPTGSVAIYVGENTGGLPWATLAAGKLMARPIAVSGAGTVLTIVPNAATGLLHVALLRAVVSPGRY